MISKRYYRHIIQVILLTLPCLYARVLVSDEINVTEVLASLPLPTAATCENKTQLGTKNNGDMYISFFVPCNFTFYTPSNSSSSSSPDGSDPDSFVCSDLSDYGNPKISRVFGWPDSCVALGPRCYDLRKYPDLQNFTGFDPSAIASYYGYYDGDINTDLNKYYYPELDFPQGATFVSVDCSADFAEVKEKVQEAVAQAPTVVAGIVTSVLVFLLIVILIIVSIICCCCCGGSQRRGYTEIRTVYTGPPVVGIKV